MIYSLNGRIIYKEPFMVVVECSGVGYACRTTGVTSSQVGSPGSETMLYTYLSVREDNVELFGFCDKGELNCFKMLTSVTGVGPKAALAILSDIDFKKFALTVASNDSKAFTRVKGIGPKLAQRIVLELKDKIAKESSMEELAVGFKGENIPAGDNISEAVSALMVLGYTQSEAAAAVAKADSSLESGEIIKYALKIIGSKMK